MATSVDDLVQRQAAILAEIDNLNGEELESFANSPLPEDAVSSEDRKARKLLRGLVRSRNVGSNLKIISEKIDRPGVIPALPGFFLIDLMPLASGGFDREHVMKTPVIAWKIDDEGCAEPLIPGMPVTLRWAVLTPADGVITDYLTHVIKGAPVTLKDWIESEIEWVEDVPSDLWTASQKAFAHSGPLPRAIWSVMAGRRDWAGTPEEMLAALSKFRDRTDTTGWPSGSAALAAALGELQSVLASVGLLIARTDDGRLLV